MCIRDSYYPGCSAKGSSADYEKSTQAVCAALGMYLEELPGWNCCGSTPALLKQLKTFIRQKF